MEPNSVWDYYAIFKMALSLSTYKVTIYIALACCWDEWMNTLSQRTIIHSLIMAYTFGRVRISVSGASTPLRPTKESYTEREGETKWLCAIECRGVAREVFTVSSISLTYKQWPTWCDFRCTEKGLIAPQFKHSLPTGKCLEFHSF